MFCTTLCCRNILKNLRDNHIGFIDFQLIANIQIIVLDITQVMNAGSRDNRSIQFNWIKNRNRSKLTSSTHRPFNFTEYSFSGFIFKLERNTIIVVMGSASLLLGIGNAVILHNHAINRNTFFNCLISHMLNCILNNKSRTLLFKTTSIWQFKTQSLTSKEFCHTAIRCREKIIQCRQII